MCIKKIIHCMTLRVAHIFFLENCEDSNILFKHLKNFFPNYFYNDPLKLVRLFFGYFIPRWILWLNDKSSRNPSSLMVQVQQNGKKSLRILRVRGREKIFILQDHDASSLYNIPGRKYHYVIFEKNEPAAVKVKGLGNETKCESCFTKLWIVDIFSLSSLALRCSYKIYQKRT